MFVWPHAAPLRLKGECLPGAGTILFVGGGFKHGVKRSEYQRVEGRIAGGGDRPARPVVDSDSGGGSVWRKARGLFCMHRPQPTRSGLSSSQSRPNVASNRSTSPGTYAFSYGFRGCKFCSAQSAAVNGCKRIQKELGLAAVVCVNGFDRSSSTSSPRAA
jgi:hypothetical protein